MDITEVPLKFNPLLIKQEAYFYVNIKIQDEYS